MAETSSDSKETPASAAHSDAAATESRADSRKRNAFTELMASKPKVAKPRKSPSSGKKSASWRDGLLEYILQPEKFERNVVLRVTEHTVLIRDRFPKATVHLLLLPRSPAHYDQHPHDAFSDPDFLVMMQGEAGSAAVLAAAELKRLTASRSATLRARSSALDSGCDDPDLPPDRDFASDIRVGIHAHPSMNHLHVHIISRDMRSEKTKHRKHYNSFNTPFFVELGDYPLGKEDARREASFQNANLRRDLACWRCGRVFGNRFQELKGHLEEEWEDWSRV